MATLTNKETNIRSVIGEASASFWTSAEIQRWYLDGQQIVIERVPPDALKNLLRTLTTSFDGSTSTFSAPTTDVILERVNLLVHESDGQYGDPWSFVTPEVLELVRSQEGELEQDSTDTRIFCVTGVAADVSYANPDTDNGYTLYPTPANGRTGRLSFIIKPSESGDLTLPANLQYLAEYYAIARAASKKSRDLDMMRAYDALFEARIQQIIARYGGRWGLTALNPTFTVRDVMGYQ